MISKMTTRGQRIEALGHMRSMMQDLLNEPNSPTERALVEVVAMLVVIQQEELEAAERQGTGDPS